MKNTTVNTIVNITTQITMHIWIERLIIIKIFWKIFMIMIMIMIIYNRRQFSTLSIVSMVNKNQKTMLCVCVYKCVLAYVSTSVQICVCTSVSPCVSVCLCMWTLCVWALCLNQLHHTILELSDNFYLEITFWLFKGQLLSHTISNMFTKNCSQSSLLIPFIFIQMDLWSFTMLALGR